MGANQLDPGLDGEVGKRVGQQPPRVLGTDEFPARRLGISLVQRHAGSHRADQGCREAPLDPGRAQNGACLAGKGLGPVPFAARHRDQRPLAQRGRDSRGRVDLLPDADRILQGQVATIEVTAQDARDPWRGCRGGPPKTVEANRDSLRPLLAVIGRIPLKDLTVQDARTALKKMAGTHATRTLQNLAGMRQDLGGGPAPGTSAASQR